ncbi:MAG: radical SAM protein, partial [Lachnospiraceae bacterium]|nr:radical SAM protein [Lachnospiraceae bacterium]
MLEKKENTHRISGVRPGSIAEEAGILPGDVLLKAGGQELNDIFDYYYYEENGDLELLILHEDGE